MATDGTRVSVTVAGEPVTREVTLGGAVAYLEREGFVEETGEKHRQRGDRWFWLRRQERLPSAVFDRDVHAAHGRGAGGVVGTGPRALPGQAHGGLHAGGGACLP